ncbi:MAG: hypothetical protein Kow0059_13670 [Candidatus Sumerlaeia bacterium]
MIFSPSDDQSAALWEAGLPEPSPAPPRRAPHRPGGRWAEWAIVAGVLVIGAAMRVWGLRFGFPDTVRPDEEYFANIVRGMDGGGWNPHFYYYPHFFMHFNVLVWRVWVAIQMLLGRYNPTVGVQKFFNQTPYILYLLGRVSSAAFGVATVGLLYATARRLGGRLTAVPAALFLALNPTHALNSHFFKSDIVAGFFILASLHAMVLAFQGGSVRRAPRRLVWAGVWAGLALSSNYYGGFLAVPLGLAVVFHMAGECRRAGRAGRGAGVVGVLRGGWPWAPFAAMLLAFFLTSPYVYLDYHGFLKDIHRMLFADRVNLFNTLVAHDITDNHLKQPLVYSALFSWRYTMGVGLFVLSALGVVRGLLTRRPAVFLIAAFSVFYLAMTSTGKAIFVRYYAPVAPLLCLLGAALLADAGRVLVVRRRERSAVRVFAVAVASLALVVQPAQWTIHSNRLLSRKDTRSLAREYLEREHSLPPRGKIACPLNYYYGKPQVQNLFPFVRFTPDRATLERQGVRLIVWDTYYLRLYSPAPDAQARAFLEREAELIAVFSPVAEGHALEDFAPVVDQLDAFYLPIARFEGIERPGPLIEIYRLKGPSAGAPASTDERDGAGGGLRATYYASSNFEGAKIIRRDGAIDFNWGTGSPQPGMPPDQFSVVWEGQIHAPLSGMFNFYLQSDDGSRLTIDDTLVIDHWGRHGPEEKSGSMFLSEGWHDIKVEYFEDAFGASVRLMWQFGNDAKAVIPPENFRPR